MEFNHSHRDLQNLIPIRPPMLLLADVLETSESGAKARVEITQHSMFADQAGNVPNYVGVEYMAQTIATFAGNISRTANESPKPGFLVAVDDYDAKEDIFENGKSYTVSVEMTFQAEALGVFTCRITRDADGRIMAEGQLKAFQPDDIREFLRGEGR
jgi:predicted hotdog family 3-hydroxylacyl-ACP dehydratase